MSTLVIRRQFRGPPNSGNGGYVCGVLAAQVDGVATAMIRAPVPLDVALELAHEESGAVLTGEGGLLIGQVAPATQALPEPPPSPGLEVARAAMAGYLGHIQRVHPTCLTCGPEREEGDGLRVFAGPAPGAEPGVVAAVWTPHSAFADAEGRVPDEIVWAALDCPGFFAWIAKEGRHGALLGSMSGDVTAPVTAGREYVVLAWPIAREGRKETAGVALYDAEGQVVARGHQVWIIMAPRTPMPAVGA